MSILDASAATFPIPVQYFDLPAGKEPLTLEDGELRKPGEFPLSGYRQYLLFALKTRILQELQELLGRNIVISFTGYPDVSMRLSFPGEEASQREPHVVPEIREAVSILLQREATLAPTLRMECLLMKWNSVRYLSAPEFQYSADGMYEKIPSKWLRSIIEFLPLDQQLADNKDIPEITYRDGGLYADCLNSAAALTLEGNETYTDLYGNLVTSVMALMRQWYEEGRIIDPENALVERWRLEPVRTLNQVTLYKPVNNWGLEKLYRGTLLDLPVSALLWDLAKGKERSVGIRAGVNLVNYHAISRKLFGGLPGAYHFSGAALHFTPKDLDDLLRVLNGVSEVLYGDETFGTVVTLTASRFSWLRIYSMIVSRAITTDIAVYVRRDTEPMFVFSFKSPDNVNVSRLRHEIVLRARRLFVYLLDKMSTPGYSKSETDIHALLDNPETVLPDELSSPTVRAYTEKYGNKIFGTEDLPSIQF